MTDRIDTTAERDWLSGLSITLAGSRHSHACDGGYSVVGAAAAISIQEVLAPRFAALLDEVDAQRAENQRLREALRVCEEALDLHGKMYPHMVKGYTLDALNSARAALSREGET